MSAVYSIRMAAGSFSGTSGITVATVPAGYVWVVRSVVIRASSGNALTGTFLYGNGSPGNYPLVGVAALAEFESVATSLRQVMNAGDKMRLVPGGTNAQMTVSGYQLTAP